MFEGVHGKTEIRIAFRDHAPQFVSACQQQGITFDHSLPGRPMNNSFAERNNLYVTDQVSACLLVAGLPPCYWSFALTSTCHLLNVEIVDGENAWYDMHGDHFGGKSIPLGAYVHFKTSPTRDDTHKFAPRSMRGVFAGFELWSGMRWSGKMLVWELDKFLDADLTMECKSVPMSLRRPHVVDEVIHSPSHSGLLGKGESRGTAGCIRRRRR